MKGFAQGLGVGLVSVVALPAAGIINGGRQFVRGCANTAEAVEASQKGKVWDSKNECWKDYVPYSLPQEAAEVLQDKSTDGVGAAEENTQDTRRRSSKQVSDIHFYDMLNIPTDATAGEIKKAYYKEVTQTAPLLDYLGGSDS